MQLVRKLLSIARSRASRNQKIRGLSTAELVGIIVIIGILGALGGTYIGSLVTTANSNTGNSNASSLNSLCASMLAAGVPVTVGGSAGAYTYTITGANSGNAMTDTQLVTELNNGIQDPTNTNVIYRLTPQVKTAASYVSSNTAPSGTATAITWTFTAGATP
ncbi:MAG TPA: hypothetical protein VGL42_12250 [Opitutaceae bacterium]|jgi:Tfp pilus assembly protein FimT